MIVLTEGKLVKLSDHKRLKLFHMFRLLFSSGLTFEIRLFKGLNITFSFRSALIRLLW